MLSISNTTNLEIKEDYFNTVFELTKKELKLKNVFVSLVLVDNKKIKEINKEYRGKNKETDVISFAFEDEAHNPKEGLRVLGEIYISIEKAEEQSRDYCHSLKRELSYLMVHGLLHLLGYNHETDLDKKVMRELEEKILSNYAERDL